MCLLSRIHVESRGFGPDLVLVHGLPQSPEDLSALAGRLAGTHRVHVIHLPGYGRSPALTGEYDLSAVADATAARLSELERPLLVGFSSGGYRVLQIALKHPRIVRGVVALAPMIAPCLEAASLLASADAAEAGFDLTEPLVQTMFSPTFRARHEDSCRRIVRELMIGAAPLSVPVAELRAFARAPDLAPALVGLAVPLLVRVGTEDGRVSEAQSAAASAPNGELQLVPDAGHMLHYEDLAGTCDAIGRFDARCTGA